MTGEQKHFIETYLLSAYVTGQSDARNRANGNKGRPFKAWLEENNVICKLSQELSAEQPEVAVKIPEYGDHGGPFVILIAKYEDGTEIACKPIKLAEFEKRLDQRIGAIYAKIYKIKPTW